MFLVVVKLIPTDNWEAEVEYSSIVQQDSQLEATCLLSNLFEPNKL